MAEMVQIRSVKEFFRDFIAKPAKENGEDWLRRNLPMIKVQILEAFRKEIFGQIVMKLGPETMNMDLDTLAEQDGIQNILNQAFRKWRRMCILAAEYGLGSYLRVEDLQETLLVDRRELELEPDPGEDVTERLDEMLRDEAPVLMKEEANSDV